MAQSIGRAFRRPAADSPAADWHALDPHETLRPAGGVGMRIALQAAVLYASAMNHLFHTVVLPLAALASTVLWAEELRNLIVRAMRRAVR